ncbi:MAG: GGDEF domain-containing protein [Gammaproteobacteria bacterium]|nr:GGDEF domain-containing protein [Gammaproteobacteria bacterium]
MNIFIWNNLRKLINSILEMRVSLQIIILLLLLFLAVISGSFLAINQLKVLSHDAFDINNMGSIRGSIQRISNRELSNQPSDDLVKVVDDTFKSVHTRYFLSKNNLSHLDWEDIHEKFDLLEANWATLKKLFLAFRVNDVSHDQVLEQSELCWQIADEVVFGVQKISERKLKNYKELIVLILLIVGCFVFSIIILVHKIVHKSLEFDVITDPMTKLYNRMYFTKIMHEQVTLAKRYDYTFSLLIFDLDYFKRINDDFGHQSGDQVLILLSTILKENARDVDYIFRLGGEEFGIIVPETNLGQAEKIAEKYRKLISETVFDINRVVTISVGVSQFKDNENGDVLFKHADEALYKAKSAGRNQVITS